MKKISRLFLLLVFSIIILSFTSCKKVAVISEDDGKKYIDAYYEFLSDARQGFVAIDLRNLNEEYAEGHLKGFISYQYYKTRNSVESDSEYESRMSENFRQWMKLNYSTSLTIFLIDSDGSIAKQEAIKLFNQNYKKIFVYENGYNSLIKYNNDVIDVVSGTDDCGC